MARIQIRTDDKVKRRAQKVLKKMGMDLSTAINLYLVQIALREEIPFSIRTENGFTPAQERKMIREAEYAEKYGKSYSSAEEMMKDILAQ